uniref:RGSL protein n=1 Tax=Strix occidentalis caurina TaxID=311401 RepID=A0A8D0EK70_STROC
RTTIASTNMGLLLRDDIFVDFFNTFLNLPVFGQTPIYISSTGRWDLWPELPPALLAWLEKHRLPHFCKSSLCLHLVLCQKLLGFIRSGEAAKLLNWQSADQWLLEKCISGSQGMWHFWAFVQGKAGEELTNFWLTTERLLGLDESDAKQRDLYLSLLHKLKATHLREGSSVVTLCRTVLGSLPKAKHFKPISTRREILSKIYWLPKFFIHCKMGMEEEKLCQPLLQEYQKQLLRANSQEPSGFSENLFKMHIKRSQGLSGPYCSKKAKVEIWTLVKEGRDTQEMKMSCFQVQPEREPGLARRATSPKRPRPNAEQVLHLEDICEEKVLSNFHSSAPLVHLPSLKKPVKTLSFLPWALSAETCAGRPFRDFLKRQDWSVETHLLDLWHDLEEFLPVVLDHSRENSFFLHHVIGEQICKTLPDKGTIQQLPLETRTLRSLQNHLMSGEFSPWIFRAQKEICKVQSGAGSGQAGRYSWHWHSWAGVRAVVMFKKRDHISWCLLLYRHFIKVLQDPTHLQFFSCIALLEELIEPLCFWMAVEKLVTETNPRTKKFLINSIVRNYFHTQIPAGRCPPTPQFTPFMMKASFPELDAGCRFYILLQGPANHPFLASGACISGYSSASDAQLASNPVLGEAEHNSSYRLSDLPISSMESSNTRCTSSSHTASASTPPDKELGLVKRRLFNSRLITANFLVDDLRFYLEINKFSRLADSVEALAACNMQSEKEVEFLKRKAVIISKLFLNSDIPPKLWKSGGDPALVSGTVSHDVTSISS